MIHDKYCWWAIPNNAAAWDGGDHCEECLRIGFAREDAKEEERLDNARKLIAAADRAAVDPLFRPTSEISMLTHLLSDETSKYLRWAAHIITKVR